MSPYTEALELNSTRYTLHHYHNKGREGELEGEGEGGKEGYGEVPRLLAALQQIESAHNVDVEVLQWIAHRLSDALERRDVHHGVHVLCGACQQSSLQGALRETHIRIALK